MLLFRSEENIPAWCAANGLPEGQIVPVRQVWDLARGWYGNRLSPDYAGRTLGEAVAIFQAVGLTDPFWYP